ncbi:DNA replication and repair protein RecO [Seinonella peptonophila]|uniref:DNA repair protein RecO n=1 Tax=Seinonella peptonophila TaxID=112248 RepID=A0A1M4V7A5_9BACL|nr:DNA repair protein RecO [Seinonella peptonophila]SHE64738.1 DNA replication and repair protein RecO [Seinonella peptonophila]
MLQRTKGIVLKVQDYGESDQIVRLFSEQLGRISLMARGAKKTRSRLSAATEPLIEAEFLFFQGSGISSLSQADVINSHRQIRDDLLQMAYAAYWLSLIEHNIEEQEPHPALYRRLVKLLHSLEHEVDAEVLTRIWELTILEIAGYKPIFDRCVRCHRSPEQFFLSVNQGGFLCQQCRSSDHFSISLAEPVGKLLPMLQQIDITRIGKVSVKSETNKGLEIALHHLLDQNQVTPRKSWEFLQQIRKLDFKTDSES